jgi:ribosomal protein L7/L12
MVKISKIELRDYNVCVSCRRTNPDDYMYKVISSYIEDNHVLNNITVYCPTCLFSLLLELNNIFEIAPMLDGTCDITKLEYHKEALDMPQEVYHHLVNGKKVAAIKAYRDSKGKFWSEEHGCWYSNLGLKDAKDKVDEWAKIVKPLDRRSTDGIRQKSKKKTYFFR